MADRTDKKEKQNKILVAIQSINPTIKTEQQAIDYIEDLADRVLYLSRINSNIKTIRGR